MKQTPPPPPVPTTPFLLLLLLFTTAISSVSTQTTTTTYLLQPDAVALLSFKSKADLDNKLFYTLTEPFDYCQWQGVKCIQGRVVRFVLKSSSLRGTIPPYSLSGLDQLRALSLHNNSLSGPIPDLSRLVNLKSLILSRNFFSGSFPLSALSLHRLVILDFSHNNLTGPIPVQLSLLDRLNALRLDWNSFNGSVPPLNQTFLVVFNVSGNNLTGAIPVTPTLSRFEASSFSSNPGLCGGIVNRACESRNPNFFGSGNASSPAAPLAQSAQAEGGGVAVVGVTPPSKGKHSRTNLVVGFTIGVLVLIAGFFFAFVVMVRKRKNPKLETEKEVLTVAESTQKMVYPSASVPENVAEKKTQVANLSKSEVLEVKRGAKSGCLVFCSNERGMYTLEQLMRASAELLGRGTIGTTYKAVLDNQVIVTVKRLDASKTGITASDVFERHMDMVGDLRHPNLVPLVAYFQAKGERLLIYDYQPNGSLFSLIHGSRSTRAKPLHWTSCLKIAEDVAQGLAYIHQSSKLVHGNLKSSNVLLGPDFEACITDYCLAVLADTSSSEDPDSAACKAPEAHKSTRRATTKSDVYAFGVLLIELLTGKHPSQHPYLVPADMLDWVRAMREDDCGEDNQLGMLTEVASVCNLTSPEQRPAMWQVLKMIQEIKESVMAEDNAAL